MRSIKPDFNVRESLAARHTDANLTSRNLRKLLYQETEARFERISERLKTLPIEIEGLSFAIDRSLHFAVSAGEANDIEMSLGSVLAIDDYVCGVLLLPTVFVHPETETSPAASFEVDILDDFEPRRFRSYAAALAQRVAPQEQLAFATHQSPWRLAQAELLANMAVDFVLLHEVAHLVLDHIAHVPDNHTPGGRRRLMEFESEGTHGTPLRRAAELEADAVAFQLLREIIVRVETYIPFVNFQHNVTLSSPDTGSIVTDTGTAGRYRAALLAAGLSMFLVETLESSADNPLPINSRAHPPAGVRLANIITTVFADGLHQFLAEDDEGHLKWANAADEPDVENIVRKIVEPISAALLDLENIAELFGSGTSLMLDTGDGSNSASSQLVQSIFLGFAPEILPDEIAVPAVADLVRYEQHRTELKALARNQYTGRFIEWLEAQSPIL